MHSAVLEETLVTRSRRIDAPGMSPLPFLIKCFAGWIICHQQLVVERLPEEIRVLELLAKRPCSTLFAEHSEKSSEALASSGYDSPPKVLFNRLRATIRPHHHSVLRESHDILRRILITACRHYRDTAAVPLARIFETSRTAAQLQTRTCFNPDSWLTTPSVLTHYTTTTLRLLLDYAMRLPTRS